MGGHLMCWKKKQSYASELLRLTFTRGDMLELIELYNKVGITDSKFYQQLLEETKEYR